MAEKTFDSQQTNDGLVDKGKSLADGLPSGQSLAETARTGWDEIFSKASEVATDTIEDVASDIATFPTATKI